MWILCAPSSVSSTRRRPVVVSMVLRSWILGAPRIACVLLADRARRTVLVSYVLTILLASFTVEALRASFTYCAVTVGEPSRYGVHGHCVRCEGSTLATAQVVGY